MRLLCWSTLVLALVAATGCGELGAPADELVTTPAEVAAASGAEQAPAAAGPDPAVPDVGAPAGRTLVVHKSPTCGCCVLWAEKMQAAGFTVEVRDVADLSPIKQRLGVPQASASCHTAEIGGYFVEGHVPAQDIERLLAERPDARGLAVPGMPLGSPGMEHPSGTIQPYEVLLVKQDGTTEVFATHP